MSDVSVSPAPARASVLRPSWLHLAWVQAVVAMGGSLYFSEYMLFPPCALCWYQRIAMYPLVAVLGVALLRGDGRGARAYGLPLSIIGWLIALYHCAMTYGVIAETQCSATEAVSCTIRWINWYGFITIPLLAFVAFSVIIFSLVMHGRAEAR